jgi:hypothetical protein
MGFLGWEIKWCGIHICTYFFYFGGLTPPLVLSWARLSTGLPAGLWPLPAGRHVAGGYGSIERASQVHTGGSSDDVINDRNGWKMPIIEPHIHMYSRTTDDYQAMYRAGIRACVEPSFWMGADRRYAGTFFDYFRLILEFETVRARRFGIDHFAAISLNPKEAEDVVYPWRTR